MSSLFEFSQLNLSLVKVILFIIKQYKSMIICHLFQVVHLTYDSLIVQGSILVMISKKLLAIFFIQYRTCMSF